MEDDATIQHERDVKFDFHTMFNTQAMDTARKGVAESRCASAWSDRTSDIVATCVEINILRRVRADSSRRPPRHRRDACSMA